MNEPTEKCQGDEHCQCPECERLQEQEMAFHFREYRLYAIPGPDGTMIDVRDLPKEGTK